VLVYHAVSWEGESHKGKEEEREGGYSEVNNG
jgi:hypothetical protein